MKKLRISIFFLFLTNIGLCQTIVKGKVVRIADGDTITLLDENKKQVKIRLYGIDCPEKRQDFGSVAKQFTASKCFNKFIKAEIKYTDRYGRKVGSVILPNGKSLNKELLKAGLAWHYVKFDTSAEFSMIEKKARLKRKGLWSMENPIAPWVFRKRA
ncbi:thermonuclease family protein [Olivibacter domesticus]|uniref:Endonuclease YncB, thermonuclease family n=1 Tax=Olivibacter domesticus TaxID=407022 RepID=A0A1H7MM98_OLID1|nr:thermonuclease family protein [Olivibacter domesticus]SEL12241.1 Endonuclease YncB, thermonuclease family [Olivibacter domesticus]